MPRIRPTSSPTWITTAFAIALATIAPAAQLASAEEPSPAEVEYELQQQPPGREDRVAAEDPGAEIPDDFWKRDTLTGDWLGLRSSLEERGVAFGFDYTFDVLGVVAGGASRKVATLGDWDLTLTVDAERLIGWQGASFFVYGLGTGGRNPSKYAGAARRRSTTSRRPTPGSCTRRGTSSRCSTGGCRCCSGSTT